MKRLELIFLLAFPGGLSAAQWYASPSGIPTGDGSIGNPWDLQTALNQPAGVAPGDTIFLRGGTYQGKFVSNLTGTSGSPIVVHSYSNEVPVIDGIEYTTTLAVAVSSGGALGPLQPVYVTSATIINSLHCPPNSTLTIDQEMMLFNNSVGNAAYVTRGWNGTTAVAHNVGALVTINEDANNLTTSGSYTWFDDLTITYSAHTTRVATVAGSNPLFAGVEWGQGIGDTCNTCKYINLVIHDVGGNGVATQNSAGGDFYGNVIYNNGWTAPDRGHGHGFYIQNLQGNCNTDPRKYFEQNVLFNPFSMDYQLYDTAAVGCLTNVTFNGNVIFNGSIVNGGATSVSSMSFTNNMLYNTVFSLGYAANNYQITISSNYLMDGYQLTLSTSVVFNNNTVWNLSGGPLGAIYYNLPGNVASDYTIDYNTYYPPSANTAPYSQFYSPDYPGNTCNYFWWNSASAGYGYCGAQPASWQQNLGYDANSTLNASNPSGVNIFFLPNQYDPKRATIAIFNWDQNNTVAVDPSSILAPGDAYELHSVLDYENDVVHGVYGGGNLAISMAASAHTVALPTAYNVLLGTSTFPTFGVFILRPQSVNSQTSVSTSTNTTTPRLNAAVVYPNPVVPPYDPTIRVCPGLVDSVSVTIFDISGRVVNSGTVSGSAFIPSAGVGAGLYCYEYAWTGHKSSGIYFAIVHAKGSGTTVKARLKFAVVR